MQQISEEIYAQLRQVAAGLLSGERRDHTLQATALLHEAVLKINARLAERSLSRADLVAAAAQAMRWILVDHARTRNRLKRGGGQVRNGDAELLGIAAACSGDDPPDLESLNAAMESLARLEPEAARIVELRFFAGLSVDDAAIQMQISPRSAARLWSFARAWLYDCLTQADLGS